LPEDWDKSGRPPCAETDFERREGVRAADFIPVARPKLPAGHRIAQYLRRIDESRIYSNFGPLSNEFQSRMSDALDVAPENFVPASCGTTALIAATLATAGTATESRPLALIPAFTFAATAIAVERCGFRPYLADVDPISWMLSPATLLDDPLLARVGLVVPVAPFGRPVPQADWIAFRERSGIPVVVDAAAAFACLSRIPTESFIGPIPTVMSFHATKSFGIGEGGGIVSTDSALTARILHALNFGFIDVRNSAVPSINGKLSEFHAAIGLAELDWWDDKYAAYQRVAHAYEAQFAACGCRTPFIGSPDVDGSYALLLCDDADTARHVEASLTRAGVDFRFWYGRGLHHHTHFSQAVSNDLSVTESLGQRLIGLPTAPDLPLTAIKRVVSAVCRGAQSGFSDRPKDEARPIQVRNGGARVAVPRRVDRRQALTRGASRPDR
jgi:dTDP-4-amino-4,6-dideoxygalactose transaminase